MSSLGRKPSVGSDSCETAAGHEWTFGTYANAVEE
jgi:hypothetical protein